MNGFIESSSAFMSWASGLMWSLPTFIVLLGLGVLYTFWTRGLQWRALTHGVAVLRGRYDRSDDPGALTHFQALAAALSGTVGLGNIGGVALAIAIGGPGALFWMWVTGFLGMALKAVEVTLAMMYRNIDDPTRPSGGAMWVIDGALRNRGPVWKRVGRGFGIFFAIALLISTITGGNMFQAWNVCAVTSDYFGVPDLVTAVIVATLVGLVVLGGVRRIGTVAAFLAPFMCALYVLGALVVLVVFADRVPAMLALVVSSAFAPATAGGSFLGAGVYFAFKTGLQRALFSNEAGQGSAPIAHAASRSREPARVGVVAGLEPFVDTLVICTLTGLVILVSGMWNRDSLGPLSQPVEIAADADGNWVLDGAGSTAALPKIEGEGWRPGDRIFVTARVEGASHVDTAQPLIQVFGTVTDEQANDRGNVIAWEPVDVGSLDAVPTAIVVEDPGVYRVLDGAPLTARAFDAAVPGLGRWLVTLAVWLFAISTMITWAYYGEQGVVYLTGGGVSVIIYRVLYVAFAVVSPLYARGADTLTALLDFGTGIMLWANLPVMLLLGHHAVREFGSYFRRLDAGEIKPVESDAR